MKKKQHKSSCCNAPVIDVCADEGTCYWKCEKCGNPCTDTYYTNKKNKEMKKEEFIIGLIYGAIFGFGIGALI